MISRKKFFSFFFFLRIVEYYYLKNNINYYKENELKEFISNCLHYATLL
jgi:hypothetical protein